MGRRAALAGCRESASPQKILTLIAVADVVVVGAGPAGLVAARSLSLAGRKVMLLAPDDRDYKIGECIPGAINRLMAKLDLPMIDSESSVHREISGVISLWAGQLRRQDFLWHAEGASWRLDRRAFEQTLEDSAVSSGVMRQETRVRRVIRQINGWRIETDTGFSTTADFLIDATGRTSVVARQQSAQRSSSTPLIALWARGSPVSGRYTNRTLVESVADGWWYAAYLPDNRPLAIFHTSPGLAVDIRREPDRWRNRLRATQLISRHILPDAFERLSLQASDARSAHLETAFGPGWAACGDAALSFDPISSQGIFNGMSTGKMIAEALLARDPEGALERYQRRLNEIRRIYAKRRASLYESAWLHFNKPFWDRQSGSGSLIG